MDFFIVPTATFRVLYVLFVIRHGTREILQFNVTEYPKKGWVCQQIRESFPWDETAEYLIFDRDSKFSTEVVGTLKKHGHRGRSHRISVSLAEPSLGEVDRIVPARDARSRDRSQRGSSEFAH